MGTRGDKGEKGDKGGQGGALDGQHFEPLHAGRLRNNVLNAFPAAICVVIRVVVEAAGGWWWHGCG